MALVAAPAALADGDPASDVLAGRTVFNPIGSGVSPNSQARLSAVLAASERAGFPIRVALIAGQNDLGTATKFWNDPGDYAHYLWIELSLEYGGQILVVMPNGFGLWGPSGGAHAVPPAEAAVRAPAPAAGERLAVAAIGAVPLLAAAAGHPIPPAALARANRNASAGEKVLPTSTFTPAVILTLILGALLIAAAWWASLRARPLQTRRLET